MYIVCSMYIYLCIYTSAHVYTHTLTKEFNGFHLNIKFTNEKSKEKVDFLHAVVKIKNERLTTVFYSKPVGSSQYLHYDTCYAEYI